MSKLSKMLYNVARRTGKAASLLNDIETLASGNPSKIAKRIGRKAVYKTANKTARKITKNIK